MSENDQSIVQTTARVITRFCSFEEQARSDLGFWRGKTPEERLGILEILRRRCYGYDETVVGLQRILRVSKRPLTEQTASGRPKDLADLEYLKAIENDIKE